MLWNFSLICNQCPRQIATISSAAELHEVLQNIIPLNVLFGPDTKSVQTLNGEVISGICIFRQGHHPTWEACPNGGEYTWRGLLQDDQLIGLVSVVSTWLTPEASHVESILGVRLVNKNKQNLPLLKLEFWCARQLPPKELETLAAALAKHVNMVGLDQLQYTSHAVKSNFSKYRDC